MTDDEYRLFLRTPEPWCPLCGTQPCGFNTFDAEARLDRMGTQEKSGAEACDRPDPVPNRSHRKDVPMVEPAPISATGKTPTFSRCPFCDAPPDSKVERVERTMFVGDYRCPSDHVWMLKTVVGQ